MLKRPFAAYKGPNNYIFVCYAHADAHTIYPEITMLHDNGIDIWYDEGIEVGQEWRAEIAEAIEGATAVLFYHSRSSTLSKHCVREISYALDTEIPILRIDLDGSALPPALRLGLQAEQAIVPELLTQQDYADKLLRAFQLPASTARIAHSVPDRGRVNWWWYAPVAVGLVVALSGLIWVITRTSPSTSDVQSLALVLSDTEPIASPSISPDGSMLAYAKDGDLFVRRVAGGEPVQLTDSSAVESYPSFSPDGELITFTRLQADSPDSYPDVYVMPSLGGNALPVIRAAVSAAWSYDGTRLVYVDVDEEGPSGIGLADSDGSNAQTIYKRSGDYRPYVPRWSPDGSHIVFVRSIGGTAAEIWLMSAKGTQLKRLGGAPGHKADSPIYTPDGSAIIHTSSEGGALNIWKTPIDGSAATRLTTGPGPHDSPTVSADGSVAFLSAKWRQSLNVYDPGGKDMREIHTYLHYLWGPAFSPDGSDIAFSRAEPDGSWHVWLIDSDGGAPKQLTFGDASHIYPRFTPDAQSIIYMQWAANANRVWRVPRIGGTPQLLSPPGVDASYADISTGGELAYVVPHGNETRIHVKSIQGGKPWLLMDRQATLPRWSPDGKQMAYTLDRGFDRGIFLLDADGSNPHMLSKLGGFPVWWPDASKIGYLIRGQDGNQEIQVKNLASGDVETLAIKFRGLNHPFDVDTTERLATTQSIPFSNEVWLLK